MMWFFASVVLVAAITSPGFRKLLLVALGSAAGAVVLTLLAMGVAGLFR
ncbi:MAG TPA: hypothetical protein VNZ53_19315 [Steroidobacteraceae bacterium]|jgi:hypothetical protein|nr:hypothetical protein [Steroidobacteraceae bacterium]